MEKDCIKIWDNCCKLIKDNINSQSFRTWFEPIKPLKLEKNVLTIQVPSQFFYEWLEEHYIGLLKKSIKKELGSEGRLEYSIIMDNSTSNGNKRAPISVIIPTTSSKDNESQSVNLPATTGRNQNETPNPFIIPGLRKVKINNQLVDAYSFDSFIEGDCNRLARAAGLAISENPGKTPYNPLFIYSNVGLGKTHLAHAIGLRVRQLHPEKTVLYISSEQFYSQYIESVKNFSTNDFTAFYQMIDFLIVDDIHFLNGKEKTQDIFFHIFNSLHQNGKQLVITCDKPPVELQQMEQRIISRFIWGLTTDLQLPDLETRVAILQKRLYNDGIEMPDDVIELIAGSITSNVRELEGAMISILAQSSLNKKDITIDLARQMLERFMKNTSKDISISYIQKVIGSYYNIPIAQLNSKSRIREIVQARQLSMYFAKKHTKASLASIGEHCGKKDHATVLHACRTISDLLVTDKTFKSQVDEIEKKIKLNQ